MSASDWEYFTANELVDLVHDVPAPVKDWGKVEACAAAPALTWGGKDLYPAVWDKAARSAYSIAKVYHPFHDGNKRAAAIVSVAFCRINGYDLKVTEPELVAVIVGIVDDSVSYEQLTAYYRSRIT